MDGIELAARFALPPNSKRYCGKGDFREKFAAYLKGRTPAGRKALEKSLGKFNAHHAYLKLIAKANEKKPFDEKVAEALWIGNGLLKKVERRDLQKLIAEQFSGKGMLSAMKARKLASSMPEGMLPHHSFHVLHVHTISGVIVPSVKNADSCRVSWGKVIGVKGGGKAVLVKTQKLASRNGKLALLPVNRVWKTSCAGIMLLPDAEKGDIVASHWGVAVMGLSKAQARQLERATLHNIRALNRG
ncbi:Uncharacterised protein [uncultured archaeon]|nr:Uncharacterised protein [uncultured archaeon]